MEALVDLALVVSVEKSAADAILRLTNRSCFKFIPLQLVVDETLNNRSVPFSDVVVEGADVGNEDAQG